MPASVRPRIKGTIPIDVRVHIDDRGRVTSAAPVVKRRTGLDAYLAGRAVEAARLWRFEPARENGKAVAGDRRSISCSRNRTRYSCSLAMKLSELARRLDCRLEGDGDIEITGVRGIEQAGPGHITFLANPKYAPQARNDAGERRHRRPGASTELPR